MKIKLNRIKAPGRRLSITQKIAIALCLLITFFMGTAGASVILRDQAFLQKEYEQKGWNIVHTAIQFSGNYLQIGNLVFLNDLVKNIGQYQDISYAMVLDAGGKVLAHTDSQQVGNKLNDETTAKALAANSDIMKIHNDQNGKPVAMDFYSPIKTENGSTMGYFRLGMDLAGLNAFALETAMNIAMIVLGAIIAGILLAISISRRILQKPLSDLVTATEKLSTGDFSYKVPVRKQDELGDLATSFNTMIVHLSNLIQSIKSSAYDINKSAEQILGRLHTSDQTNVRLSQTFDFLKQGTEEQVTVLKQSVTLSKQLFDQSNQALDSTMNILNEVNKANQTGEKGVSTISGLAAKIDKSVQSLENTRISLNDLEEKAILFGKTIEYFSGLLDRNANVTVQVALLAARSGNEELARTAEEMHKISENSGQRLTQMKNELKEVLNTWQEAEEELNGNRARLVDGREAVRDAVTTLEKVMKSLHHSKGIIEETASTAHRQSSSIEDIVQSQNKIIEGLIQSINKSCGAGSDTQLQMENLNDIDSLAKKMMRMVDRLNVLSLQFKV